MFRVFAFAHPVWLIQSVAALAGLSWLALSPPVDGAMLLIPLADEDAVAAALDAGAGLVGIGPIAGSIVVHGNHAALAAALPGTVILAAPFAGCGGEAR